MAIATDTSERQVIPRLREPAVAIACGEMSARPLRAGLLDLAEGSDLDRKIRDWERRAELEFASDVIGTSLVVGAEERAQEAAQFALESTQASRALTAMARAVLHDSRQDCRTQSTSVDAAMNAGRRIARCRHRLRDYPRNPMIWLDLAGAYLVVGELDESVRAMKAALGLDSSHRMIVRSASRLFVHLGEEDRALWTLRRSEIARTDPWIAAAEIAVAGVAGERAELRSAGKRMAEGTRFGAFDLSELASALGTATLAAGDPRKSKRLIRQSLVDPAENAVAQAEWMAKEKGLVCEVEGVSLEASAEGSALSLYIRRDWSGALDAALNWFADQPFASEPAIFASHMAAVIDARWDEVIPLLETSHRAGPENWTVLNNLAFTTAMSGDVGRAAGWLGAAALGHDDPRRAGTLTATAGMIEYRRGEVEAGRQRYQSAVEVLSATGHKHSRAAALVYWAQEEARLGKAMLPEVVDRARSAVHSSGLADLETILARVDSSLQ